MIESRSVLLQGAQCRSNARTIPPQSDIVCNNKSKLAHAQWVSRAPISVNPPLTRKNRKNPNIICVSSLKQKGLEHQGSLHVMQAWNIYCSKSERKCKNAVYLANVTQSQTKSSTLVTIIISSDYVVITSLSVSSSHQFVGGNSAADEGSVSGPR